MTTRTPRPFEPAELVALRVSALQMDRPDVWAAMEWLRETGTYHNDAALRSECWAVNQRTGEKRLLGWCSDVVPPEGRREWERWLWTRFLRRLTPYADLRITR